MAKTLRIGDLVARRSRWEGSRDQQNVEASVVIEVRRNDCRVFNPATGRGFWIENEDLLVLRVVSGERSVLSKIHRLLRSLDAIECEIQDSPDGTIRLDICHETLDVSQLDELRAFLDGDLVHLRIEPRGMAMIKTVVEFR